jgi:hypothetical protein
MRNAGRHRGFELRLALLCGGGQEAGASPSSCIRPLGFRPRRANHRLVLVVTARDDVLVPWTASAAMAGALPNAELWLVAVVDPAPFDDKLLAFPPR